MSAYVNTKITLNGNVDEILKMIDVIKKNKYLEKPMFNNKFVEDMSSDELVLLISDNNEITLDIAGPYGMYKELPDTRIYEAIASVAPDAEFVGVTDGNLSNRNVEWTAKLINKKLYLEYFTSESNNDEEDRYIEYISEALPIKVFCELFKLDKEEVEEDDYLDFLMTDDFDLINFDDFLFYFDDSELTEREFKGAIKKIIDLNIKDYMSFSDSIRKETFRRWEFDPLVESPKVMIPAEKYAREISSKPEKIDFEGKIFVLTYCPDTLDNVITKRGGIVKPAITLKTNYLVIGDYMETKTVKVKNAYEYNLNKGLSIEAMTLSEFWELLK